MNFITINDKDDNITKEGDYVGAGKGEDFR